MKVFLTGGTGVVGSALIPELLRDPDTSITLLMRADDGERLEARRQALLDFLRRHYAQTLPADAQARVEAVAGDITAAKLGLGPEALTRVTAETTHYIHSAANVRMNLSLDEARRSAVHATREVVSMARQSPNFRKLDFVSTVGVGGRMDAPLPERWIDEPREFHNTYEASKAEAEEILRAEAEQGLALTVHRPSMVVGDSRSGAVIHFQIFYFLCEFLSGKKTLGIYPSLRDGTLDIIPNDYVAQAIAWSARTPEAGGKIFHLCAGPRDALALEPLKDQMVSRLRSSRLTPPQLGLTLSNSAFMRLMTLMGRFADAKTRRAIQTLPVFLDYLQDAQVFPNDTTAAVLEHAGIVRPRTATTLDNVIRFYIESRGRATA